MILEIKSYTKKTLNITFNVDDQIYSGTPI